VWGSEFISKDAALQGGIDRDAQAIVRGGARCASQVLRRCVLAVFRGAARCASQSRSLPVRGRVGLKVHRFFMYN